MISGNGHDMGPLMFKNVFISHTACAGAPLFTPSALIGYLASSVMIVQLLRDVSELLIYHVQCVGALAKQGSVKAWIPMISIN